MIEGKSKIRFIKVNVLIEPESKQSMYDDLDSITEKLAEAENEYHNKINSSNSIIYSDRIDKLESIINNLNTNKKILEKSINTIDIELFTRKQNRVRVDLIDNYGETADYDNVCFISFINKPDTYIMVDCPIEELDKLILNE